MAYILIVDDDKAIRQMLRKMLEAAGHEVDEAEDGRPGEKSIDRRLPDLLITDIIMPDQEGIGLILSVRRKYRALKILAISGGGRITNTDYLQMAKELGADEILTKPFRREELLNTVRKLLGET